MFRRNDLEAELRSPPVPSLRVVSDLVVRLHAEPARKETKKIEVFGQYTLCRSNILHTPYQVPAPVHPAAADIGEEGCERRYKSSVTSVPVRDRPVLVRLLRELHLDLESLLARLCGNVRGFEAKVQKVGKCISNRNTQNIRTLFRIRKNRRHASLLPPPQSCLKPPPHARASVLRTPPSPYHHARTRPPARPPATPHHTLIISHSYVTMLQPCPLRRVDEDDGNSDDDAPLLLPFTCSSPPPLSLSLSLSLSPSLSLSLCLICPSGTRQSPINFILPYKTTLWY